MDIKTLSKNIDNCKSYFSPSTPNIDKEGRGYRLLDGSINALKVISYFTIIIPATVALVWGISAGLKVSEGLKGRAKPVDGEDHPVTAATAPLLSEFDDDEEDNNDFSGTKVSAPVIDPVESVAQKEATQFATPNWGEMRQNINLVQPDKISKISKAELLQTIDVLEEKWDEIHKYGQWDKNQQVLHLRKGSLPRAVEIHKTDKGVQIYVLHKGTVAGERTPKLGTGSFKEVARSVNLETLKPYVDATIDIDKKAETFEMPPKEIYELTTNECRVQGLFQDDDEIVHLAGWTEYKDKDGSQKIGITLEQCNGGDLMKAIKNPSKKTGKMLNDNIDDLMQVMTDLIQTLVILEEKEVINRDIKPDNIFLHVDDNGHVRAKMSDFGLAWTQEEARARIIKDPITLSGTPEYVPPEYAKYRTEPYSEDRWAFSTNTWQMGVTLYRLLTSNSQPDYGCQGHPYEDPDNVNEGNIQASIDSKLTEGKNIPQCLKDNPQYIQPLRSLIFSMLQVNPKDRPSAAELLQEIKKISNK